MRLCRKQALVLFFALLFGAASFAPIAAQAAQGGQVKTFAVLPFVINGPAGYKYLEQSIPSMFVSRLHWDGHVLEKGQENPELKKAVSDEAAAEKIRTALGVDYIIWGSVTVVGEDASLDVRVRGKDGKTWPKSRETRVNGLIPALKGVCDSINTEVFGRTVDKAVGLRDAPDPINQMNPELVHNANTPADTYLNPQFRYSGGQEGDSALLRSQQLPYKSAGMEIVDADGDGRKEVFILGEHHIYAYYMESNGALKPLASQELSLTLDNLSIRSFNLNQSGVRLIVNAIDEEQNASTYVLTFNGKSFNVETKGLRYFMNVVRMPPDYTQMLIGQSTQPGRFLAPNVYEMMKNGNTYMQGGVVNLPEGCNVFNFTYLPQGKDSSEGEKIVNLTKDEKLRISTAKGSKLAVTDEHYSGSSRGIEVSDSMPGMGRDTVGIPDIYYVPLRMIPVDLQRKGSYELVVNHPISTAAEVFPRYRTFPQSEIHALYWDGAGLNLQWKTKRIKATVVDFTITDANNDGILDLAVCVNTYPGALGLKSLKTMLFVYPLDLSTPPPSKVKSDE